MVLDFVDADGGTLNPALDMRYLHGNAVDQVLAQETAGNTVRWMLADHQGTVRDLVDNAGSDAGNHVVFDSFGQITSGTLGTRFAYTGQEYDSDVAMYYYNARWYNPGIGRFVTKDPIGFAAGDTNQYRYVGNDAANATDPSGLHGVDQPQPPKAKPPYGPQPPEDDEPTLRSATATSARTAASRAATDCLSAMVAPYG